MFKRRTPKPDFRRREEVIEVSRSSSGRLPPLRKKPLFEALESRVLLSADLSVPGLADALHQGLTDFTDRLDDFLDTNPVLNTPLPLVVRAEGEAPNQSNVAATLKDLLSLPVDLSGDGILDATPGSIEQLLDVLDTDTAGSPGFGRVDVRELLLGGLADKVNDPTQGIAAYAAAHPGSTLADYFNQASFDLTIGGQGGDHLSLTVSASNTGTAHEISANLSVALEFDNTLPLDLGIGADNLGISLPGASLDLSADLDLTAEVGVVTSGEAPGAGDFFIETGSLTVSAGASLDPFNAAVNVGFLGAQVNNGVISLTAQAQSSLTDPRDATGLGFAPISGTQSITAGSAPAANTLADSAAFLLRIGDTDTREAVVAPSPNTSLGALIADLQTSVDAAGFAGLVNVGQSAGRITLSLPSALNVGALDFGNEVSVAAGGVLKTASPVVASDAAVAALGGTSRFLFAADHGLPVLVNLDLDSAALDTVAELLSAINLVLVPRGAEAVVGAGADAGRLVIQSAGAAKPLQITRTIALDSKITAGDIHAAALPDLVSAPSTAGSSVNVNLPVSVTGLPGFSVSGAAINFSGNPFSAGTLQTDDNGNQRLSFSLATPNFGEMLNFNNLSVSGAISILGKVADWLDGLKQSPFLSAIDLPFAQQALGDVLDLADSLRDALLFDDNDTPDIASDDVAKLLNADNSPSFTTAQELGNRLNDILPDPFSVIYDAAADELRLSMVLSNTLASQALEVDLGTSIGDFAGISASGSISLDASVGLSLTLGFYLGGATSDSLITPATPLSSLNDGEGAGIKDEPAVTGVKDVRTLFGRLSGDARFTLQFDSGPVVTVTVPKSGTASNLTVADLVADINAAFQNATAADGADADSDPDSSPIHTRISAAADGSRIRFNVTDGTVSNITIAAESTDPAAGELGVSAGTVNRADGVLAFRTARDVPVIVGQLTGDATFNVSINGGSAQAVTVARADTVDNPATGGSDEGNRNILDLVQDVNRALFHKLTGSVLTDFSPGADVSFQITLASANTLLNGQVINITVPGTQTAGATDIDDLVLVVNDRIQSALIPALAGAAGSSAGDDLTTPLVLEARAAGNAIQITATGSVVTGFSVTAAPALGLSAGPSTGLSDKIVASSQGSRLVFTAVDPAVTSFTVTAAPGSVAAAQLGIATTAAAGSANGHDLVIYLRSGGSFRVSLDGDTTIQDVMNSVAAAAPRITVGGTPNQPAVILQVSDDGTRLEAIDRSSGGGTFRIEPVNGSAAAARLGILKSDVSNDQDTPDGRIEGLPLGGLTLADRLFLENAIVSADVAVAMPSVSLDASLGFVGVHLTGSGGFGADFSAGLKSPGASTAGGRVTLAQLVDGLGDIGSVVATPVLTLDAANPYGNKLTLTLSTTPSFTALGIDNPSVEIALLGLGNPFGTPATAPDIAVRSSGLPDLSGLGDLFDARDLNLSNIVAGLDALVGFLNQFEAFGFLSKPLPVVGVSVNDLMGVAEKFAAAVEEFESNPAGSIQALEERLFQALGLPSGTNLIDFALEVDDMNTADTGDDVELLRVNLGFSIGFVEELGIDLDLSDFVGPELGDVVRLAGAAGLQASGNLDLSLDFGFDLENPSDVYLFDSTGIAADLTAVGSDLTFRAALGPVGLFIKDGTASISAGVIAGINPAAIPAGSNRVLVSELFSGGILGSIQVTPSGSITATLPAYFPTESVSAGDITLSVDLLHPGDLTVGLPDFDIDPSQFSLLDNMMLALDGIDLFLSGLQDVLDGEVFGLELPLIGDSLADAAQFIAEFREDFIGTFREKLGTVASPTENIVSQLLFDLLSADSDGSGPDIGLDLLRDFDPGDGETDVSIEDIILATNIGDVGVQPDEVFMQWNMVLGGELVDVGTGIGFDLGVPGLGLSTEGDINLNINWELDFGFGLSVEDGFYLDISSPSELTVNVAADITGLEVTGRLAFLQIVAVERTGAGHEETTHLAATFGIDIYNRRDEADTKLGFSELGGIGIAPLVYAEAVADLDLALELNSELVPGASTNFPRVVAGFELRWELGTQQAPINLLTADLGNAISEGLKLVEFQDVSLDLGSFISDVVGPIVQEVQKVTKPIQPIIEFLTRPIPVISDLGPPVTLLDIAGAFGSVDPSMIKALGDIVALVNAIPTSADNLLINFGDFTIFDADDPEGSALSVNDLVAGKPKKVEKADLPAANDFDTELANKPASPSKSFAQKLKSGGFGDGFSFPLLESPSDIFGLLMGNDVTLIGYDLAPLSFDFQWSQFFSIFGPLGVSITAQAGATIDFAFGYDTAGIREFAESGFRNPELLFDGFFVSDNPTDVTGAGPDLPELTLNAGFSAAAELNLGVARAGVAGGIFGEVDFNLFDPNHDGKVRITEIVNSVTDQARFGGDLAFLAPLAMFDISGEIFARLFAFLEIDLFFFSFSEEWNITPPITLLEFDIPFTRTPSLADELAGGVLQLNLGEFAAQRVNGSLADGDETFTVTGNAGGLTVSAFGVTKTYTPDESGAWTRIIALGGEGDDIIDLSGVSGAIEFEIDGGAGDDHIYLTKPDLSRTVSGRAVIHGGLGDDEIWGGGGDDTIWGEAGTDTIHGAGGSDLVFGDEGSISDNGTAPRADDSFFVAMGPKDSRDILRGDAGDDIVFGGGGDDDIDGGEGADLIIGDAAKLVQVGTVLEVRDHDAEQGGADTIAGGGGNDRIYSGGGGDTIDAGAGDDLVYAGTGRDSVTGGTGVDTVYGGAGNDTLSGGEGGDFLFGEAGNDLLHGEGGEDEIRGGIGADRLTGGADNDKLWGEADPDILEGNEGDDRLDGGYGNDSVTGGAGTDTVYAGFGSDTLDGGAARDLYFISTRGGRTAELTTIYDSGAAADGVDELTLNGTIENDVFLLRAMADAYDDAIPTDTGFVAKINAGGAGVERYNYRNIEFITLNGFAGDDRFASDDTAAGVTINGGPGRDDFQVGQMFKSRRDTGAETANLAADDMFDAGGTVETTRGWLSNGISLPMTINGGDDDDTFTVFRNRAVLTLAGGDGDDLFTVRAFALAGSADSERARTDMKGDGGADTILYAINAPVGIDGGDGFDTVRVIGTEFSDDFVVTDGGVFGAGLNVTYVNVERLTVDGAEGDDRYFVLSTHAGMVTEIAGGLGSDTFLLGGSPNGEPIAVVSNDLRGHSGLILHGVESVSGAWDGIPVEGLSANVADNDEDFIVITPSDGVSRVMEGATSGGEGWQFDSYTVALTRSPDEEVTVSIQAPVLAPEEQAKGARSLEFWNPATSTWGTTLQLSFTTASSQSVRFRAANDTADEGTSFGLINHVVASGDAGYDELASLSVRVQILDNDEAGVIVRPTGTETRVVEGFPGTAEGLALDRYDVILSRPSTQPVTVTLTALNDQVDLSATSPVFAPGEVSKTVTVTAKDDGVLEGFHSDFIRATVVSPDMDRPVSQPRYRIDFNPDLAGNQDIPADDPQAFVLLRHKPEAGTVQLWVDNVLQDAESYRVIGNTLVFVDEFGQPNPTSGRVEVTYTHIVEGFHQTPVEQVVVDVYDNEAPTVLVMQSAGSCDVTEGGVSDSYQVVLTSDPGEGQTVTVNVAPQPTRTTGGGEPAYFEPQVDTSASALSFTGGAAGDWMSPQTVTVTAIDDAIMDGSDTQVFDSSVRTVNKIRGPLYVEGASGEGSISLPEPLMLPGELNVRASAGAVTGFSPSTGEGAIEAMTVQTADLEALGLATLEELVGRTVEITGGPGLDRMFQILDVSAGSAPGTSVLLLQNPSRVDAGPAVDPTAASRYAITTLSPNFFVNEADQVDFLMVFDAESVANESGSLSSQEIDGQVEGRVTGFGMGPDIEIGGGLRGGGITYGDMEVLRVDLGRGSDQVTVDSATRRPDNPLTPEDESGFHTLTLVNTGPGDDTVTVTLAEGEDGAFALRAGAGNDRVLGQLSTRQLVVFGEEGNDQIWGGGANDILFGDLGRVDYVDDAGEIVTRLGHTWPQDPVNPPVSSATATSVTDIAAAFPTEYGGLAGLVVQAISPAGVVQTRIISANTGDTLTVSQPWTIVPDSGWFYRISMLPEDQTDGLVRGPRLLWSVENAAGGSDTIHGMAGADVIIGGAAGDALYGEAGDDIVAGDNARVDFDPVTGRDGPTELVLLQTTGPDVGARDVIRAGDGDNIVLAGMGGDAVATGAGADIVLGDNGRVLWVEGMLATIETSDVSAATGGTDTVYAGAGADVVLAGALGDAVHGEGGNDILLGDNGTLQYLADADALLDTLVTGGPAFGGADRLYGGDGDDVVVGGAAGDLLYGDWDAGAAGTGNDLLAGDGISIEYAGAALLSARSRDVTAGGVDTVEGNGGRDLVVGGAAGDRLYGDGIAAHMAGDDASDVLLGDNALLAFAGGALQGITSMAPTIGGADVMEGNADKDILIGGTGSDTLRGDTGTVDAGAGDANDLMFGDHGRVDLRRPAHANFTAIYTGAADGGGNDLMYGNGADDIMLGQQGFDRMFGGDGDDDLWGGHNVAGGNDTGDAMDGGAGFDVMVGDNAIILRRGDTLSPLLRVLAGTVLFHGYDGAGGVPDGAAAVTAGMQPNPNMGAGDFTRNITLLDHAADTAAGLYGGDRMAGGPGDDLMFGQLGDDVMLGDGSVTVAGALVMHVEASGDGDDYMEGNGGADTLYGNLGQDDLLGGSSDLFGLTTPAQRPDGNDTLYGGAGTDTGRYYEDAVNLHARDADVILGDNGRIFRVVGSSGAGGGFLTFNYDAAYGEPVRIIPRACDLLDYTPGGGAPADIGGADLVFGESGDDIIHGMAGGDILFGNAGDDDLYGGAGSDWMSGGNGVDGMLGDDGRIFTSRNGLTEPLHGVTAVNPQETIATQSGWLTATLYTGGELNKRVDLEPFDQGGDDTMYGGLGDDFMHGGAGNDGMSGAEAESPIHEAAAARFEGTPQPALVFDEATGRFTAFDNTQPRAKIAGLHLNFEATDGTGAKINDGNDRLFGDLGHDWLVGGTNSDHLYGGYGNDLLNGDDNLDTTGTDPVTGQFGDADVAFGGAGRDQLIANTGADRLVDWAGEFNAYWVPFAPFGQGTVSRSPAPHIAEFLYALSRADGADFTRPGDPARNGEPAGELGLVRQQDPDWNLQTGGPADPQPGNGNDKKDVQR